MNNKLRKLLIELIEASKFLGLEQVDLNNAKELLENHEYGLAYDTIITQLYEYEIEIDQEFYVLIEKIGKKMNMLDSQYSYMKELVRDKNVVPKPVKDKLAKIIDSLGME